MQAKKKDAGEYHLRALHNVEFSQALVPFVGGARKVQFCSFSDILEYLRAEPVY